MKVWFDILIVALFGLLIFIALSNSKAHSHEWYDKECCSDKDCAPVEEIKFLTDKEGRATVSVKTKHGYAEGQLKHITIRPSKDDEYHACLVVYHAAVIRCLYVPAGG